MEQNATKVVVNKNKNHECFIECAILIYHEIETDINKPLLLAHVYT